MCDIMETWLLQLLNELNASSKTHLLELSSIINRMGMDEKTRAEWISIIKEQIQDTYSGLLEDAKIYQNKLIDSIEELLKESEALCKQLHIKMPSYGSENLSLSQEKDLLKHRIKEYENMVNVRKNELDNLKKRQLDACKSLGQEPIAISESPMPTLDEIDNFANYIERLEDEKFKRESKFIEVKCKILDIVQELEITPSLEIEKTVCSPDDSLFHVTDINMKWIDEYYESLDQQKTQTINEIKNLREKLSNLWEMLSEDVKTSNEFLEKYKGNSLITLHALQTEVKRCEKLKRANIEKFIMKMRTDLITLWEQCHFTACDRESFEYFHDNLYTEDLLTFHDIEVEKIKKYYEDNKDALKLLEAREQYWKKRLELEEKERDPNRYKNRCATLLKEQKEHSKVVKKINEMEQELLILAEKYEERHGKPFLSWGRAIVDIIEKTHEDYEADKKKQLSAEKQQRNLAVTPTKSTLFLGSTLSSSRRNLHTLTPSAGMTPQKRKMPPTSLFSSSKKKTPLKSETKIARVTGDKKKQLSAKKQQRNLAVTPTKSTLFLGSTLSSSRRNLHTLTPSAGMTPQKRKMPPTSLFSSSKKKTPLKSETKIARVTGDKKKQLSAKKQQRNLAVTPTKSTLFLGSTLSSSRRNLHTLTPSAGMTPQKRKMPPTSLFSSSKKKTPLKTVCDNTKMNTKSATDKKRTRFSIERKKRLEKIRRLSKMLEKKKSKNEESFDYDNFEKEIAIKPSCRSTLFDAASCSNAKLAEPLPQTPKRARATPQRERQPLTRTPTFTKLRTVPGSKMDI